MLYVFENALSKAGGVQHMEAETEEKENTTQ